MHQELAEVRQRIQGGKQKLAELEAELQDLAKRTAIVRSELDADERREAQLVSALAGARRRRSDGRRRRRRSLPLAWQGKHAYTSVSPPANGLLTAAQLHRRPPCRHACRRQRPRRCPRAPA